MRLFLALELPPETLATLADLRSRLPRTVPGWRWVRPEGVHLTLRFLGEVDEARESASRVGWRQAANGVSSFRFKLSRIGCFPERGRPRVLYVGVDECGTAGRLNNLASSLEQAARSAGFPAERRPFRAHLTLARALRGQRPARPRDTTVDGGNAVRVDSVSLVESHLESTGARYTVRSRFPLAGGFSREENEG